MRTEFKDDFEFQAENGGGAKIWPARGPERVTIQRKLPLRELSQELYPGHCGYEFELEEPARRMPSFHHLFI